MRYAFLSFHSSPTFSILCTPRSSDILTLSSVKLALALRRRLQKCLGRQDYWQMRTQHTHTRARTQRARTYILFNAFVCSSFSHISSFPCSHSNLPLLSLACMSVRHRETSSAPRHRPQHTGWSSRSAAGTHTDSLMLCLSRSDSPFLSRSVSVSLCCCPALSIPLSFNLLFPSRISLLSFPVSVPYIFVLTRPQDGARRRAFFLPQRFRRLEKGGAGSTR